MSKVLKGKEVAEKIREDMICSIQELKNAGRIPTLAIVRLGRNAGDVSYEKSIIKACEDAGIISKVLEMDISVTTDELASVIKDLNRDSLVSGILLFRPLPKQIDEEIIRNSIDPSKDVDCMHPLNLEKIFEGRMDGFSPCTPKAAMEILIYNQVPLEGRNVVVVNRSMVVGKPLVMMLLEKNATVTICHSRTKNLEELTSKADIVVTALGKAKYFTQDFFTEDSVVIDVGVSMTEDGKLSGDVDYEYVESKVKMITPVPGGVGSVTTTILLNQVVLAELNKK